MKKDLKEQVNVLKQQVKELKAEIVIDNKVAKRDRLRIESLETLNKSLKELNNILKRNDNFQFTLPPSINILGINHKVKLKSKVMSKGKEVWGLAVFDKREIQVSRRAPDKFNVLAHEIFHHVGYLLNSSVVSTSELWANTFAILFTSLYSQIHKASSK